MLGKERLWFNPPKLNASWIARVVSKKMYSIKYIRKYIYKRKLTKLCDNKVELS